MGTRRAASDAVERSVRLRHAPDLVWDLLVLPENALLIGTGDGMVRSMRVPGTPRGVGEQHMFVHRDGAISTVEVVAYEHRRHAVVVQVPYDETGLAPARMVYRLRSGPGGCRLTYRFEFDRRLGLLRRWETRWGIGAFLDGVRSVLDDPASRARITRS